MRKILFKLNCLILSILLIFINVNSTVVYANDGKSFQEILKDNLGITSYENQKKMMKDTFKSVLESIGISYSKQEQFNEDFENTLEVLKANIDDWYNFCYDFTIRKLFHGKENIDKLIHNKVIKDNKVFGELYNRFSNIIFNNLNKKYYYLKKNKEEIVNKNYEYINKYNGDGLILGKFIAAPYKFNIVDVDSIVFSNNELIKVANYSSPNIIKNTKYGFDVQFSFSFLRHNKNKIIKIDGMDFHIDSDYYLEAGKNFLKDGPYSVNFCNFDFYRGINWEALDKRVNTNQICSDVNDFDIASVGYYLDDFIFNLFKCEYYNTKKNKVCTFFIGDTSNDFNKLKKEISLHGLLTYSNKTLLDFDLRSYYENVKNVQPLKIEYVMRPYNINYYNKTINSNFNKDELLTNIKDLINEHLSNYNLEKDFKDGLNSLKSNYNYNSAIISNNQVTLSNQLTDLQNNFNSEYNYLNDLLNDFIDNKYRKQQQELSEKLDKLSLNVDNNKEILKENNNVLLSYGSEIKTIDENLKTLELNSDNNYKSLNKKVDEIYTKLNNIGNVDNSNVDLSEIKRLNDRIKEINEQDPRDRIGESISFFDKFINFFKDFFVVTEKFNFNKIETDGIAKKIPFSIFYDISSIIKKLTVVPKVPKFDIPIYTEKITVDFDKFESLAVIVRSFILLYIVILLFNKVYKR